MKTTVLHTTLLLFLSFYLTSLVSAQEGFSLTYPARTPKLNDSIINAMKLDMVETSRFKAEELKKSPYSVFVFLSPECPLCQKYSLTLRELEGIYAEKGVKFVGVFSGKAYPIHDIKRYGRKYKLHFPFVLDPEYKLAKQINAEITPQVFVMDNKFNIVYSGAIDNWYIALGQKRQVVTEKYLADALEAVLAGKQPARSKTNAVGCFIFNTEDDSQEEVN